MGIVRDMFQTARFIGLCLFGGMALASAPTTGGITLAQAKQLLIEGKEIPGAMRSLMITWAAEKNSTGFMSTLLDHPSYKKMVNKVDLNSGMSPLGSAASKGNCEVAAQLIKAGADSYQKDKFGLTPFMSAAFNGKSSMLKLLIDNAPNKDKLINAELVQNGETQTPLCLAVRAMSPGSVHLLLKNGANRPQMALKFAERIAHNIECHNHEAYPSASEVLLKKYRTEIMELLEEASNNEAERVACELTEQLSMQDSKELNRAHKQKMIADKLAMEREKKADKELLESGNRQKAQLLVEQQKHQAELDRVRQEEIKKVRDYEEHMAVLRKQLADEEQQKIDNELKRVRLIQAQKKLDLCREKNREKQAEEIVRDAFSKSMDLVRQKEHAQRLVNRFLPKGKLSIEKAADFLNKKK